VNYKKKVKGKRKQIKQKREKYSSLLKNKRRCANREKIKNRKRKSRGEKRKWA
jgi:hypothetical protein